MKANIPVLQVAIKNIGLRVGVKLCELHIKALYDYMKIPAPGSFGQVCSTNIIVCTCVLHVLCFLPAI